jgi:TonB family protein
MAWKKALYAKLYSEDRALPDNVQLLNPELSYELRVPDNSRAMCRTRTVAEPPPKFPPKQKVVGGVGAVVLKLLVDEAGKVTRVQVAGSVGGQAFTESVVDAARQWHAKKLDESPTDCGIAKEYFASVIFRYD